MASVEIWSCVKRWPQIPRFTKNCSRGTSGNSLLPSLRRCSGVMHSFGQLPPRNPGKEAAPTSFSLLNLFLLTTILFCLLNRSNSYIFSCVYIPQFFILVLTFLKFGIHGDHSFFTYFSPLIFILRHDSLTLDY